MGLAERKVKQRIGHDPRNLSWSGDTNRFSYKHMTALGWNDSQGLGQSGDGNPNHIAVVHKLDNGGIGMNRARKEGDDQAAGAGQAGRGLEDVLKRLAAASASASPSPAPETPAEASASDKEVKKRNKIASRQRHLASKRLASSSPAALAEILGVPIASLPTSPAASSPATPAESSPEPTASPDPDTERTAEETVKKSTLSVTDYFRQKMKEKMLARQAAAGGAEVPTMPEGSLALVKEEKKVDIGGVAWEGSKMEFKEEVVELADLGAEAGPSVKVEEGVVKTEAGETDEKAAKRARKEAKRLKKLAEEVKREAVDVKPSATEMTAAVESEEARAKREKKERKEERRRAKEAGEGGAEKKKRKRDDEEGKTSKKGRSKE